ncbi:hypothetical protein THAOC_16685 [Thalassiosira oceanica]|uniref:Uncharacterized protein n=1 Tax=Thalassiosira oceanica TaxID=159749 RepID=K0SWY9_THAOC|nr:hypothetical protein THAOC_16685 [Thalassiosira oceanica]|eukprot:EJK62692.1 hypothetical protein THAOC_16685 [Thalassiosira oceanica]
MRGAGRRGLFARVFFCDAASENTGHASHRGHVACFLVGARTSVGPARAFLTPLGSQAKQEIRDIVGAGPLTSSFERVRSRAKVGRSCHNNRFTLIAIPRGTRSPQATKEPWWTATRPGCPRRRPSGALGSTRSGPGSTASGPRRGRTTSRLAGGASTRSGAGAPWRAARRAQAGGAGDPTRGRGGAPAGVPATDTTGTGARAPNPFDDDSSDDGDSDGSEVSDDDDEGSIEVNAAPVRRLPPPRARPNPFLDDGDGSDFPSGGDLFADSSDYEDVETSNIPAMRRAGPNPFADGGGDGRGAARPPPNPFDDSSDDESIPNREAEKSYGAGQPTAEQDDDSLSDAPGSFRESPPRLTSSPAGAKDKGDGGLLLRGWSSPRPAPEPSVGPAGPPRAPDRPSGLSPPTPGGHSHGTGSTYSSGGFEISSVEDGSASGSYFSGSGRNGEAGSPAGRREDSGSPKIRLGTAIPSRAPRSETAPIP